MPAQKRRRECLSIRAGEHVALIADEVSKPVAASLAAALHMRRELQFIFIEGLVPPDARGPNEVLQALERRTWASLYDSQSGELGARMAIVKIVERRQIRYAHMVG